MTFQWPTKSEKKIVKEEKGEYGNLQKSKKQKILKEAELSKIEPLAGDREKKQVAENKK